jgi:hypothetical protein
VEERQIDAWAEMELVVGEIMNYDVEVAFVGGMVGLHMHVESARVGAVYDRRSMSIVPFSVTKHLWVSI